MNNNDWTPVEDKTPNSFNKMLDDYVAKGAPIEHGAAGWAGLGFYILIGLVVIGFCALLVSGFSCVIDINCLTWLR